MTPTQIETASRNRYNSIGDSFFSQLEIFDLMYQACIDLTRESNLIERTYSTSTVIAQQEYAYPSLAISIKRITYNGNKLKVITQREDDAITGLNQTTTASGTPQYYYIFNKVLALRPIPAAVGTLKINSYNEPDVITAVSTLEIPTHFHLDLVYYIVGAMAAKDSNLQMAQYYDKKWELVLLKAKKWSRLNKRSDSFATVQDEDQLIESYIGTV